MKFHSIYLIILSFVILSCNGQTSKNVTTVEAKAFAEKIAATLNPQILDVRTPEEFASGHIDSAKNVDWLSNDFITNTAKFDKSKPVFVYCKSGGRSQKAAEKLSELGFTTIYQLDGGILKWDAAGLSKPSDKIIGLSVPEYNKLLNSEKKILINFYAEWCAPCKKMTPYILQMQKDLVDKVTVIRLNADENKTLLSELKISELPTLLLYENKEVKWKHSGFIREEDLKKQLQ
ncbi:thioredoxin domain-containing protein [Flavobacterium sp.]|uniref:thioredoxin domain-containing protein n=1 Tax=Flavobacterium sp. TaxID=239 RepID=UPI001B4276B8|nr:thioredoxin domain-containing protein [Flavobacterium sp.]MBP6181923.1 thioredoxin fold domain-containing protein [Flavobacterium sp.]